MGQAHRAERRLSEKAEAGWEGNGAQDQSERQRRAVLGHLPSQGSAPAGQAHGEVAPQRAPLIPEDLEGVRRGSHAGHGAREPADGRDRNGKLHRHLAFRSICSRLSPWLPTGTNPSALDSSKGGLPTSRRAPPCPSCPPSHPRLPGRGTLAALDGPAGPAPATASCSVLQQRTPRTILSA